MTHQDSTDRLLKRSRQALEPHTPSDACLDAETIGAWASGTLSSDRRAAAEVHAADCSRCLGIVAAFARTEPPAEPHAWVAWLRVRWLAPATAAATVLLLWIVVERPAEQSRPPEATSEQTAATMRPASPAEEPQAPSPGVARQRPPDPPSGPLASRDAAFADAAAPSKPAAAKPSASERPATVPPAVAEERQRRMQEPTERAQTVVPAPPPPDASAAGAEGVRALQRAEPVATDMAAAAIPREIVSPDPAVRWRFAGTIIERTADGGRTWQRQEAAAPAPLLAGSSPAPDVCWIAGASGTVLRSTDGDTWTRIPFPEAVDLVAIAAPDGRTAAVRTADGRTFRTADDGRTWVLQETPTAPF